MPQHSNGHDTYESLLEVLTALDPAPTDAQRQVHWAGTAQVVGLARDPQGHIEIFIAGPQLRCTSPVVAANMAFGEWDRGHAGRFYANQLRLPAPPHFDAVAAFLCTHLLDKGADSDPQAGLTRSEPVIEMAFERSRLQGEALLGLCGELLVLRAVLDRRPDRTPEILAGWHGYRRSARDLQLGPVGLEVKTTRGSTSRHPVQGVHQVEVGHGHAGHPETVLYLVSIGAEPAEDDAATAWTLPGLVDSVLERVQSDLGPDQDADALTARFLDQVRSYGSGFGEGYDHRQMRHRVGFATRLRTTFVRAYDMADDAIAVLRRPDLAQHTMLDPDSVTFTVDLPMVVHGEVNPISGLTAATEEIARRAWG